MVAGSVLSESAVAQTPAAAPLKGHFHPKGKAPSRFTKEILAKAKTTLPFGDTKDFEEQKKGLIASMKELKIMADAGHVAWDMERFQFLERHDQPLRSGADHDGCKNSRSSDSGLNREVER